jgi:predicted lipoprotein with Yx(FWY)xxD motif
MRPTPKSRMRPTVKSILPALPILAVSLTLAACGGSSSSSSSSTPAASNASATSATTASSANAASTEGVKTASNAALGETVLVDAQGRTLYHLTGEQNGKFLCTSAACVAAWPPVSASTSALGAGVSGLAAVRRPDGSEQVAYMGEPLYTFSGDRAAGEANGQGIRADGGTWLAVTTGASGSTGASAAQSESYSGESGSSGAGASGSGGYGK